MESDVLRAIAGIGVFPALSLVLFVLFFGVMLIWTARLDRQRLSELAEIPLRGDGTADALVDGHDQRQPDGGRS